MTSKGKYEKNDNFTTVYSDNAIYTIARNTGEWGVLKVGEFGATGHQLTQEIYDKWEGKCTKEGTFSLN